MSIDERLRETLRRRADDVTLNEELWDRIDARAHPDHRDTPRRIAVALVALVLAFGSFALVLRAFGTEPRPQPAIGDPATWQVREFFVGDDPGELLVAEGSVWVARDGVVTRVEPSSGRTQDIPVALRSGGSSGTVSPQSQLTYGDGRIWAAAEPFFVGIDARSGQVERSFVWESGVTRLTFHDGRLFYGGSAEGTGQIRAIDPLSKEFDSWGTGGAANPTVMVTEHWIWAADSISLVRVAPDGDPTEVVAGIEVVDSMTAVDDAVWVTGGGALWKVNAGEPEVSASPQSEFPGEVEAVTRQGAVSARASVAAGGGHLWLLEEGTGGTTLTELDPSTGSPAGPTVSLEHAGPAILTVDERGEPWVTYRNEGVLVGLAPSAGASSPDTETATPEATASLELEVSCEASGVRIATPVVQPTAEGVHVVVTNPGGARYIEFHGVGSERGSSFGTRADPDRAFNWWIGPGSWLIACTGPGQDYRDVPTQQFDVVDPEGHWIPPGLDCEDPTVETARVDGTVSDDELAAVALAEITGVFETDVYGGAGYGGRHFKAWRYWGIVVREGERVASVKVGFNGDLTIESCMDSIHWVDP